MGEAGWRPLAQGSARAARCGDGRTLALRSAGDGAAAQPLVNTYIPSRSLSCCSLLVLSYVYMWHSAQCSRMCVAPLVYNYVLVGVCDVSVV